MVTPTPVIATAPSWGLPPTTVRGIRAIPAYLAPGTTSFMSGYYGYPGVATYGYPGVATYGYPGYGYSSYYGGFGGLGGVRIPRLSRRLGLEMIAVGFGSRI